MEKIRKCFKKKVGALIWGLQTRFDENFRITKISTEVTTAIKEPEEANKLIILINKVIDKLQQIDEFEATYKPNTNSIAMKKWCTDYEYRKREWQFRQGIARWNEQPKHNAI